MRSINFIVIFSLMYFAFSGCRSTLELGTASEDQNPGKPQPDNLNIYLLIGQSNMAGRAEIEWPDFDTLSGVFLFTGMNNDPWEKAANPLNKYSTIRKDISMQKLSPAYTFARDMAESSTGAQIGLVMNARGGTSISLWEPGSDYYKEAVSRTKDAMKYGVLKGIAWHQGESDASEYEGYTPKIAALIEALREEFHIPDLPVVVGQLSEDKNSRLSFNQMITQLPEKIRKVGVVRTENTSTIDDTHFDSSSQRLLGERYAKEMLKLLSE